MSVIIARTISSASDKRIVLSNSQFARALPFGTNWNALQLGIRFSMRDTGANITGSPQFWVGLCSGNSNLVGDASTTHFVGANWNAATWTRTAVSYHTSALNSPFPAKRVNTTVTRGTTLGTSWGCGNQSAANNADRTMFFVRITKGSPNFSFLAFLRAATGMTGGGAVAPTDLTFDEFMEHMGNLGTSVRTNYTFTGAQTLAVNEGSDGSLDHLNISWDRSTPQIEICDIAVARVS